MKRKDELQEELDGYALRLKEELNARLLREYGEEAALWVEDIQIRLLPAGQSPGGSNNKIT